MIEEVSPTSQALTRAFTGEIQAVGNRRWRGSHRRPPPVAAVRLAAVAGATGVAVSLASFPLVAFPVRVPDVVPWAAPRLIPVLPVLPGMFGPAPAPPRSPGDPVGPDAPVAVRPRAAAPPSADAKPVVVHIPDLPLIKPVARPTVAAPAPTEEGDTEVAQDLEVREEDVRSLVLTQVWNKRREFANLLPADVDAEAFAGLAAAALWRDPNLAIAAMRSPDSLVVALRDCARLGHEPGTESYYLTPRGQKVLGIEGYQGVIERMYRGGGVIAVHADVITKEEDAAGQFVRHDPAPPQHHRQLSRDTSVDNLAGVYAYAILKGGVCSRIVVMGRIEVMRHREVATTKSVWDGPFGISMWLKTPVDEVRKWVPTSAAYREEKAKADLEFARLSGQVPPAPVAEVSEAVPTEAPS